jgi:hypothetical protein
MPQLTFGDLEYSQQRPGVRSFIVATVKDLNTPVDATRAGVPSTGETLVWFGSPKTVGDDIIRQV